MNPLCFLVFELSCKARQVHIPERGEKSRQDKKDPKPPEDSHLSNQQTFTSAKFSLQLIFYSNAALSTHVLFGNTNTAAKN